LPFSFSGEAFSADGVGDAGGGLEADGDIAPDVELEAEDFFLGEKKEGIGREERQQTHEITMAESATPAAHFRYAAQGLPGRMTDGCEGNAGLPSLNFG
jgi:hypothetical protein